jgi:uncharacterized membrane protein YhaH (DUF805 family)
MKLASSELATPQSTPMPRFSGIVLAFWAGSLWTLSVVVAPTLFALLEDRSTAGRLAGRFFDLATLIGVVSALILFAPTLGRCVMPGRYTRTLVLLTAGLPVLSKLGVSPLMDQARAAGDMARFGALHGVSAGLFLLACACALGMVWNFGQRGK